MRVIFWIEKVGMGFKGVWFGNLRFFSKFITDLIYLARGLLGLVPKKPVNKKITQ